MCSHRDTVCVCVHGHSGKQSCIMWGHCMCSHGDAVCVHVFMGIQEKSYMQYLTQLRAAFRVWISLRFKNSGGDLYNQIRRFLLHLLSLWFVIVFCSPNCRRGC